MSTAFFTHPSFLLHENRQNHIESPDRLKAIVTELTKAEFAGLDRRDAPQATFEQIARVHESVYIKDLLNRVPSEGFVTLDPDTSLSPFSGEAALHAAGAVIAAVDIVMKGEATNAFCAVRPPGHHAEYAEAMGFCLFNNIAIGAAHALSAHLTKRIAVVDFDVHHGNGTQSWAMAQKDVMFFSSHQFPLWPGTGLSEERGPHHNIVNIPLPPETDGRGFRKAMEEKVFPALASFKPELIMISAGFDAHRADPLGGLALVEDDFAWVTSALAASAKASGHTRIVSVLEGGYNLSALAGCAGAHVKALMSS